MTSNVGKWDKFYNTTAVRPYGDSPSYVLAAEAFARADCAVVEDWGCGFGWFRGVLEAVDPSIRYVGVDGSRAPLTGVVEDLITRDTSVDGIYMRHVLEHNYDWEVLLDNALCSFTKLMVLVVFTPFTRKRQHEELRFEKEYDVPTLSLNRTLVYRHLAGFGVSTHEIESPTTFYGHETIIEIGKL